PGHVLDVGGGTGRWSRWLAEQGRAQALLDIDPSALATIRAHWPRLCILAADAQHLPVPRAAFGAVIAVQMFGHLADRPRFLAEAARVLAPGGYLFISWSNKTSFKGALYNGYSALKGTPRAQRFNFYATSHRENLRMLESAGFRVLDSIGYSWTPLPRYHDTPLVDAFVAIERTLRLNQLRDISPNIMLAAQKQ
ncbi:MAG: class I SAM-dependent methyltransferase, partial [Anaerolineales bacterium]